MRPDALFLPLLAATTLLVLSAPARPADAILDSGALVDAELVGFGEQGVTLRTHGEQRLLAWRGLVRWGAPANAEPRPRVVLQDGSVIVAAPPWTKAGSVTLEEGTLAVRSSALRTIKAPRAAVRAVLFEAAKDAELAAAFRDGTIDHSAEQDALHLVNGDVLSGELTAISSGVATLVLGGESIEIELNRVAAVRLADGGDRRESAAAERVIGLRDGTLLHATECKRDDKTFEAVLAAGVSIPRGTAADIVFLQTLRGAATYLSDRTPLDYRHTPYVGVAWPLGVDASLLGGPLRAGGRRYLKGLAMHSPSRVVYRLTPGEFTRLDFAMAIDDASAGTAGRWGSVVYRVLVAKAAGFESAFISEVVRSGDAPQTVSVDIAGARAIALVVEPADFGDRLDHALWLDARLVKEPDEL